MKRKLLNRWVVLDFEDGGSHIVAKSKEVIFNIELGPTFLMETKDGNQFWLTRREIIEYEVVSGRKGI